MQFALSGSSFNIKHKASCTFLFHAAPLIFAGVRVTLMPILEFCETLHEERTRFPSCTETGSEAY